MNTTPNTNFQGISRARWERIVAVLGAVWDLPDAEVELTRLCGDDELLRAQVEALLAADRDPTDLLSRSPLEMAFSGSTEIGVEDENRESAEAEADGGTRRIGPYVVIREIARGGMGRVLLARRADDQFDQTVAVKLLKRGLDTDEILDRFLRERQILARLQHPHIARLLDGGVTADGLPWFALEYVDGTPIDRYCEERKASLPETLRLFAQCCRAVAYAHRNLVIHRDLKPSNILVSEEGEVKLLDFGIAKVIAGAEESASENTTGPLRLMTPLYAAPEQIRGEHATTATDVYSLGVVLYKLLVGTPPYRGAKGSSEGRREMVIHELPDSPSARLGAARSDRRSGWGRLLRGDLDNIVLQALRKEPEERYPTADALAEEIERYLDGRPVQASGRQFSYVARKFIERHRTGAVAGALILLTLVGGLVATSWQARRATLQARRAEQIKQFALGIFKVSNPEEQVRGDQITARQLLDQGAERVERELREQPLEQAQMWELLGDVYRELGSYRRAQNLFDKAYGARRRVVRGDDSSVATLLVKRGSMRVEGGDYRGAEPLLRESLAMRRRLYGPVDEHVAYSLGTLAATAWRLGRHAEAESLYRETIRLDSLTMGARGTDLAQDLGNFGMLLLELGRPDDAVPYMEKSLALDLRVLGREHPVTMMAMNQLAVGLIAIGQVDRADSLLLQSLTLRQRRLPPGHEFIGATWGNLAAVSEARGQFREAVMRYQEALRIRTRVLEPNDPDLAHDHNNLAIDFYRLGAYDSAATHFREALAIWKHSLPDDHRDVLRSRHNLGATLREQGRYDEAEVILRGVLAERLRTLGPSHFDVSMSCQQIGKLLQLRGKRAEAEVMYRRALTSRLNLFGSEHPRVAESEEALAGLLREERRYTESGVLLDSALAIDRHSFPGPALPTADVLVAKGRLLLEQKLARDALPLLREGLEIRASQLDAADPRTGEARLAMGLCLTALGRTSEGRRLLVQGLPALKRRPGARDPLVGAAVAALTSSPSR